MRFVELFHVKMERHLHSILLFFSLNFRFHIFLFLHHSLVRLNALLLRIQDKKLRLVVSTMPMMQLHN